ncbi:MAG: Tim44 domain-containing protein, partial [Rhodocyclaceae bacterium]|nr:Tim44 domain-containing protein [Rhodocyclaceae bacterium]
MNKTRTFLLALCALFFVFGALTPDDAYARRMGGGGSFGMKRSIRPPAAAPKAPPKAAPAAGNAAGAPGRSSWLGPIAGIAAGLGLAALMSHLGLSEEFGSLVLLALLA